MILITKDDNTKKKLLELIKKELNFISSSFDVQKNLSTQVLKYFKELATDIDVNKDTKNMELYFLKSNKVNEMLLKSNENIKEYEKIYIEIKGLNDDASNLKIKEIIEQIDDYNAFYREVSDVISKNTSEIEAFLKESTPEFQSIITISDDEETIEDAVLSVVENMANEEKKDRKERKSKLQDTTHIDYINQKELKENTLVISEQDQEVILPYNLKALNSLLKANPDKYKNIYDVIDINYKRPIKYYKNAPVARFREAYKLARDKENMSFKGSLDLAFECFFISSLHPAIISSCENLNQLDVYLSCLEYDELDDFYFFDILYKIPPMKTNKTDVFKF